LLPSESASERVLKIGQYSENLGSKIKGGVFETQYSVHYHCHQKSTSAEWRMFGGWEGRHQNSAAAYENCT